MDPLWIPLSYPYPKTLRTRTHLDQEYLKSLGFAKKDAQFHFPLYTGWAICMYL